MEDIKKWAKSIYGKIDEKRLTFEKLKQKNYMGQHFYASFDNENEYIGISNEIDIENDYISIYYLGKNKKIPLRIDFNEKKNYFEIVINSIHEIKGYEFQDFYETLRIINPLEKSKEYYKRQVKRVNSLSMELAKKELEDLILQ